MPGVTYRGTETIGVLGSAELLLKSRDELVQNFQCAVAAFAAVACVSHVKSHISQ